MELVPFLAVFYSEQLVQVKSRQKAEGRPHRLETTTVDLRSSIHFAHLDGVDRFPQLTPLRGACKGRQPNDNATTCGSRNPNFDVPWHGDLVVASVSSMTY